MIVSEAENAIARSAGLGIARDAGDWRELNELCCMPMLG